MVPAQTLRVAIDAQVTPQRNGGVALALQALIRALGRLDDGHESYVLVVGSEEEAAYWDPVLSPNQRLTFTTNRSDPGRRRSLTRRVLKRVAQPVLPLAQGLFRAVNPHDHERRHWPEVPVSDGFYESLGCSLVHFPWQQFAVCALPTVFNPHDLQHLHYPEFFTTREIAWRETVYPAGCRFAHTVIVGSRWARQDVIRQYRVHPAKVQVIPEGAPSQFVLKPDEVFLREIKQKHRLDDAFVLYPAITWAHKNHLRLLEALAHLRDSRGHVVSLVCTGSLHKSFWPSIEARMRELDLESQVRFLGFVPDAELRAIQRLATCLVLPSLFEASSLPIFDAWEAGVPVASSSATALPDQIGDAGLLFDPHDVAAMAHAIETLLGSESTREELRKRGTRRLKDFDWNRTAKAYRAVYRRVARRPLSDEDRGLLSWDWMRHPRARRENAPQSSTL